jgi:hypothetical protein
LAFPGRKEEKRSNTENTEDTEFTERKKERDDAPIGRFIPQNPAGWRRVGVPGKKRRKRT